MCRKSVFQERTDNLVQALLLVEKKKAGEFSPTLICGIVGCSERHARRIMRRYLSRRT